VSGEDKALGNVGSRGAGHILLYGSWFRGAQGHG